VKTIWKYPVPLTDQFSLDLPENFEIVDAVFNYHKYTCDVYVIDIWIGLDPNDETEERIFDVFDTGQAIPECEFGRTYVKMINIVVDEKRKHILLRNNK
jgi:hypothetical protein